MLARLILALLLAAFAIPSVVAAAPCHETAMPGMTHRAMPSDPAGVPDRIAPAHICIGCIPPSDWLGARPRPAVLPGAAPLAGLVIALDLGEAVPPALPPPRMA